MKENNYSTTEMILNTNEIMNDYEFYVKLFIKQEVLDFNSTPEERQKCLEFQAI